MEQDARIEAENNFRSEQQLAKDRRIREQKAYRDFLFVQMNERKARENHKVPFIYYVRRFGIFPIHPPTHYVSMISVLINVRNFRIKFLQKTYDLFLPCGSKMGQIKKGTILY